jgi:hypothetical protein
VVCAGLGLAAPHTDPTTVKRGSPVYPPGPPLLRPQEPPSHSAVSGPVRTCVQCSRGPPAPSTAARGGRRSQTQRLCTTPRTPPSRPRPGTARAPHPQAAETGRGAGELAVSPSALDRSACGSPTSPPSPRVPPSSVARRRRTRCTSSLGALFALTSRRIPCNFGAVAVWC